ncbi:MAG: arsenate reductase (glutaredoxin) [Holophagaceae bacterium]|nr:arsenate reductase (glutaredoxin) [Holophagaceae bacterium]
MAVESVRVYHNARCSKSRSACALLGAKGVTAEVVDYLQTPPTREELQELLRMLGMKAGELLRRNEPVFQEKYSDHELSDEEALEAMLAHPILMERPIVVRGGKAVVARPVERVLELF